MLIIGTSFEPSPMAIALKVSICNCSQCSRTRRALTSPLTISPMTLPVMRPSTISKVLACIASKFNSFCTCSAKKVNPPETKTHFTPCACAARMSACAPSLMRSRSRNTSSSKANGVPAKNAMRRMSDSLKSLISPRIEASVMLATSAFLPAKSAISSIHSILISVESMSIASTLKSAQVTSRSKHATSIDNGCAAAMSSRFCAGVNRVLWMA